MSKLNFHKMEGAGNDFVVLDNRESGYTLEEIISVTPKLCDRKFGVGADGVLVLEPAQVESVDYTMIYRNADGSDAGMCGNGSRCLALFAAHHGFGTTQVFNVHDKTYQAVVDKIEHAATISFPDVNSPADIEVDGRKFIQVYPSTEHVVTFENAEKLDNEKELVQEGRAFRMHPALNPPGTNVNFVLIKDEFSIDLQTYERGVENLTLACGTGALASAIATYHHTKPSGSEFEYTVTVKGGILKVTFRFNEQTETYQNLKLIGPAHFVFEGSFNS